MQCKIKMRGFNLLRMGSWMELLEWKAGHPHVLKPILGELFGTILAWGYSDWPVMVLKMAGILTFRRQSYPPNMFCFLAWIVFLRIFIFQVSYFKTTQNRSKATCPQSYSDWFFRGVCHNKSINLITLSEQYEPINWPRNAHQMHITALSPFLNRELTGFNCNSKHISSKDVCKLTGCAH